MQLLLVLTSGALAGIHAAMWGAYKDSPYEEFEWRKWVRSPLLAVIVSFWVFVIWYQSGLKASELIVVFGVVYVFERSFTEFFKAFFREDDQTKYTIPMRFSYRGIIVENTLLRLFGAMIFLTISVGVFAFVMSVSNDDMSITVKVFASTIGGWLLACGGAWKDAPYEGFEFWKFLRSPVICCFFAIILFAFTTDLVLVTLGSTGYTIAAIESYKTFLRPDAPGKFAGKSVKCHEMLVWRRRLVPMFLAIWLVVLIFGLITI